MQKTSANSASSASSTSSTSSTLNSNSNMVKKTSIVNSNNIFSEVGLDVK